MVRGMVPKADFASIELPRWRAVAATAWNANQKQPPRNAAFLYGEKQAHITSGMFMDVSDADDSIDSIEDAIRADPIAVSG
jgi:hypothetical protein